jgi:hypothetical protein
MADADKTKEQLRAELAQARNAISQGRSRVGETLDFQARVRRSVGRNAFAWIVGAVLFGFVLSRLPSRKARVKVKVGKDGEAVQKMAATGLVMTVAKFAFDAARPALIRLAMTRLQPWIEKAVERWQSRR